MARQVILLLTMVGIFVSGAAAQETPPARQVESRPARMTAVQTLPAMDTLIRNVDAKDVGLCLVGKQVRIVREMTETGKCESLLWINVREWAAVERYALDHKAADSVSAGAGGGLRCSSCSASCTIVSVIGTSHGDHGDLGSTGTPSQCSDAAASYCKSLGQSPGSFHCKSN